MHTTRHRHLVLIASTFAALASAPTWAQGAYPSRPIRLVVPFPAGGGTDLIAREVANKVAVSNGWSIVVDNKPGSGGNLGVDAVAKAPADGYTLVLGQTSNLAINPTLYPKLPYKPEKDLAPVGLVAQRLGQPHLVVLARNLDAAEGLEVVGDELRVEQAVAAGLQAEQQVGHRDLGAAGLAVEHRFPEERRAQ